MPLRHFKHNQKVSKFQSDTKNFTYVPKKFSSLNNKNFILILKLGDVCYAAKDDRKSKKIEGGVLKFEEKQSLLQNNADLS